jgi:hypothetical protein
MIIFLKQKIDIKFIDDFLNNVMILNNIKIKQIEK